MFKYNLEKAIELQLAHQRKAILQDYKGNDLNECISQAFLNNDAIFIDYFLSLCWEGTAEDLEIYKKNATHKQLVQECVLAFRIYVDPEGFFKALMNLRIKQMEENKKEISI
jgi:hypothetical protein